MYHVLLLADVDIGKSEFKKTWKKIGLDNEVGMTLEMGSGINPRFKEEENLKERLR